MWCEFDMMGENDDDNSELSEHRFLTKGTEFIFLNVNF